MRTSHYLIHFHLSVVSCALDILQHTHYTAAEIETDLYLLLRVAKPKFTETLLIFAANPMRLHSITLYHRYADLCSMIEKKIEQLGNLLFFKHQQVAIVWLLQCFGR